MTSRMLSAVCAFAVVAANRTPASIAITARLRQNLWFLIVSHDHFPESPKNSVSLLQAPLPHEWAVQRRRLFPPMVPFRRRAVEGPSGRGGFLLPRCKQPPR